MPALAVRVVEQHGGLLKSVATERQLFEVFARPYLAPLISPVAAAWLKKLLAAAETVTIIERGGPAERSPTPEAPQGRLREPE